MKKLINNIIKLIKDAFIEIKSAFSDALKSESKWIKYFFGYFIPLYFLLLLFISTFKAIFYMLAMFIGVMIIIMIFNTDDYI